MMATIPGVTEMFIRERVRGGCRCRRFAKIERSSLLINSKSLKAICVDGGIKSIRGHAAKGLCMLYNLERQVTGKATG